MSDINKFKSLEIWFITGSQHLYGPAALAEVEKHSKAVVKALNAVGTLPH
jgi:L-arabinose isomerase